MKKYIAFLLLTLFAVTASLAAERSRAIPPLSFRTLSCVKCLNVGYIGNFLIVSNNTTI